MIRPMYIRIRQYSLVQIHQLNRISFLVSIDALRLQEHFCQFLLVCMLYNYELWIANHHGYLHNNY